MIAYVCMRCWESTGVDWMNDDCHTCPHCGHHKAGPRQVCAGLPCPTGECAA